VNKLEKIAINE